MKSKHATIYLMLFFGVMVIPGKLKAQSLDSILDLKGGVEEPKYLDTFYGTRVAGGQSFQILNPGELGLFIGHRFGALNGGFYEFFGLDQATMRLGLDYAFTTWLMAGFGRSTFEKTWDLFLKAKLLDQKQAPLTITGYMAASANTLRNVLPPDRENLGNRMSYTLQLIMGRTLGRLSFQIAPIMIHSVYEIQADEGQDYFSLGFAGAFSLSKRLQLTAEYFLGLSTHKFTKTDPLTIGLNIDTGGHLFQLVVGNTQGIFEKALIANTSGTWASGNIYFGFNLVRIFYLKS